MGLGYVGLPLAVAFARTFPGEAVGFDIQERKVNALKRGEDETGTFTAEELALSALEMTSDLERIRGADFYIVAVPTPVGPSNRPDLGPVKQASSMIGKYMEKGAIVCYESTVYPGVTEDLCAPILETAGSMKCGLDFFLGYSPERINPGDKEHRLDTVVKVVSGQNQEVCDKLAELYGKVVPAGVFKAASIRVAEACKITENIQRDINIALMNEFAKIYDRFGINTIEVLEAARTKWNFLNFTPGLVGGHCIGVDPYYLTYKSQQMGYAPEIILAGRRVNDGMGQFVAGRVMKLLAGQAKVMRFARVGILGVAFKENVSDMRNSRVFDIIDELMDYGVQVKASDPFCDPERLYERCRLRLSSESEMRDCDAVIFAVPHTHYVEAGLSACLSHLRGGKGILIDLKSVFFHEAKKLNDPDIVYWAL
jgi:UDP-N-acetyl-D-galactosamine dehydrogenase